MEALSHCKTISNEYVKTGRENITKIKQCVETKDRLLLVRIAHNLKGDSHELGAQVVKNLCDSLEILATARTSDFTRLTTLIKELEDAFGQVEKALHPYRTGR